MRIMSTSHQTPEEILVQARRLPEDQRRRLVADLQADKAAPASEICRQNAMKRWLERADREIWGFQHLDSGIRRAADSLRVLRR
jgi:hypothetical protein